MYPGGGPLPCYPTLSTGHQCLVVNSLKLSQCFVELNPQALTFFINPYDTTRSQESDNFILPGEFGWKAKGQQGLIVFLKGATVLSQDKGPTLADVLGETFE